MKKNRSTLQNYFQAGALPSEEQFRHLIDSAINQIDDGFDKSPDHGWEIYPRGGYDSLVSFFRETSKLEDADPLWTIRYDGSVDRLLFTRQGQDEPALALSPDGRVGIGSKAPEWDLDVAGTIRAAGRVGVRPRPEPAEATTPKPILANGDWHPITEELEGCHAFEVVAGVGVAKTGRYALLRAVALNTHNPTVSRWNFLQRKRRIRCQHAYYRSRRDRLELRWHAENEPRKFRLWIRSRCKYPENAEIQCHITRLWSNEMLWPSAPANGETS